MQEWGLQKKPQFEGLYFNRSEWKVRVWKEMEQLRVQ